MLVMVAEKLPMAKSKQGKFEFGRKV